MKLGQGIGQTGYDIEASEIQIAEPVIIEQLFTNAEKPVEGVCNSRLIR